MTPDDTRRRAERYRLIASSLSACLVMASQVASKATRDTLFLESFSPEDLPVVTIPGAIASVLAVLFVGAQLARRGPAVVLPALFLLNAACFFAEWWWSGTDAPVVAAILYVHVSALGSLLVSSFWSLVSEQSDPHHARSFVARVGVGGTFGGVVGGLGVLAIAERFGPAASLLALALVSTTLAVIVRRLGVLALPATVPDADGAAPSAWSAIARSPYLRAIARLSMLVAAWEVLIDFTFKAAAHEAHPDGAELAAFFGLFYTATGVVTFAVQTFLARWVLARGGVAAALATLPVFAATGLALAVAPGFVVRVLYRGGETALSNSIFRSAYEVLFVPLPQAAKRPTKAVVDVMATRIGDAVGAGILLAMVRVWPDLPDDAPTLAAVPLALIGCVLVVPLFRGYVRALEEALRAGIVDPAHLEEVDATTRTLTESLTLDRQRVLEGVAALRRESARSRPPPALGSSGETSSRFGDLSSPDPRRVARALETPLTSDLVVPAIERLDDPELSSTLVTALRAVAAENVETLLAKLSDPTVLISVRTRLPRILVAAPSAAVVQALVSALRDRNLDLRYQSAHALREIARTAPSLAPTHAPLLDAVLHEARENGARWREVRSVEPSSTNESPGSAPAASARAARSLSYTFDLLSFFFDEATLELVRHGLSSQDDVVRGTAIELLENLLPVRVRDVVVEALSRGVRTTSARAPADLVADLLRSQAGF